MKMILLALFVLQTFLFAQTDSLEKVKVQLQWKYQYQFAGFIMAKELGYYKEVGLDVELLEYENSLIMEDLESNKVDYALTNSNISYTNKILRDVTLVATYFQKSPLILITQKDIKSIMDLKNKRIMISQDNIANSSLGILFEYFGINAKNNTLLSPSFDINDFIEKKVDVITAFRSNELYVLDKYKIPYNIIDPIEHGFSTNAINLFASHEKVENNPQQIDNFLNATKKGWEYALKNTEEVATLIHNKYQPNKSIEHLIYEGIITKEMMLPSLYEIGEINKDFVLKTYNNLIKNNRLNKNQSPDKLMIKRETLQTWINERYIQRTEYTYAILIAIFFILLLILVLAWVYQIKNEIKKRITAEENLKHLVHHDPLTGLPNRTLFLDRLKQAIKNALRFNENIAVLFIDLDHFKEVNDSLGHHVGDILLKKVSHKLKTNIRQSDTVARLGGDEFVIILDHFSNLNTINSIVQNIMHSLKEPLLIEDQEIYVTLSLGISVYPNDGEEADTLMKNADAAMYKAKEDGRNSHQFYTTDMTDKAMQRIVLETKLRQSLAKNEMEVYYQLQMNSKTDELIGMEALIRWNDPKKGLILPDNFIPLAEETGFILELEEWTMKEAIKQFKSWNIAGFNTGSLSLNLSIVRLEQDGFIASVKETLQEHKCMENCFSFEVTESQIMKNPEKSIENLLTLNELGVKISIDDFGTGHSSLSYLKKLPIHKLKIDRSFVSDLSHDSNDREIAKTIISMAKNLNLEVIAEGVETQEQLDFLSQNDCNEIQGYFYHKPAPAHEIEPMLKKKV